MEADAPLRSGRGILLVVLVAAFMLRAWDLGRDGLWADEAQTAAWTRLSFGELVAAMRHEPQAPLYHLLLLPLRVVAMPSETLVRAPSIVFALLAIAAAWALARRLAGTTAAGTTALLLATSPMLVHYSREARTYALLAAAYALALLQARRVHERPGPWGGALLGAALVALALAHGVGPAYVAGVLAFAAPGLVAHARERRAWLVAAGVLACGWLPWALVLRGQVADIGVMYLWHAPRWESEWPWQVLRSVVAASPTAPAPIRNAVAEIPPLAWLGLALVIVMALAGWRWREKLVERTAPLALLAATLVPALVTFATACVVGPIHVVGRVDAGLVVPIALGIALGIAALPVRRAALLGIALAAASLPAVLRDVLRDTRSQERIVAAEIAGIAGPRETLVVAGPYVDTFRWYLGRSRQDLRVLGYPPERERHPFWVDWQALEREHGLERAAAEVAAETAEATPRSGSAWALVGAEARGDDELLAAMDARMDRAELRAARFFRWQLGRWRGRAAVAGPEGATLPP